MGSGYRQVRQATALFILFGLTGCGFNNVVEVPPDPMFQPAAHRAVLVYGMAVEGESHSALSPVRLEEYSIAHQDVMGNCFFYNRTETRTLVSHSGRIEYFAFDVPAGYYTYGPLFGRADGQLRPPDVVALAFSVPPGRVVYVGDFIYGPRGTSVRVIEFRRNFDAAKAALRESYPALAQDLILAETVRVVPGKWFTCIL